MPVSVHCRMCLVTARVKVMGDLSDFQKGQTVGVRLAVASVTKTATSLVVPRAAVSKFMATYTTHGKPSAKGNSVHPLVSEGNE